MYGITKSLNNCTFSNNTAEHMTPYNAKKCRVILLHVPHVPGLLVSSFSTLDIVDEQCDNLTAQSIKRFSAASFKH